MPDAWFGGQLWLSLWVWSIHTGSLLYSDLDLAWGNKWRNKNKLSKILFIILNFLFVCMIKRQAGCNPIATSLIADYFAIDLRGAALGIYNWGIYSGYSASFAIGNQILKHLVGFLFHFFCSNIKFDPKYYTSNI